MDRYLDWDRDVIIRKYGSCIAPAKLSSGWGGLIRISDIGSLGGDPHYSPVLQFYKRSAETHTWIPESKYGWIRTEREISPTDKSTPEVTLEGWTPECRYFRYKGDVWLGSHKPWKSFKWGADTDTYQAFAALNYQPNSDECWCIYVLGEDDSIPIKAGQQRISDEIAVLGSRIMFLGVQVGFLKETEAFVKNRGVAKLLEEKQLGWKINLL